LNVVVKVPVGEEDIKKGDRDGGLKYYVLMRTKDAMDGEGDCGLCETRIIFWFEECRGDGSAKSEAQWLRQ
jgi:hypothetical protein